MMARRKCETAVRVVSMLAEYIELAVHFKSNSNVSDFFSSSSNKSVEQKDGLAVPDFCLA